MSFLVPPCASILGEQQPRTHYQVLGVSRNEQDPRVIEEAALRCTGHIRAYQLTRDLEVSLRLNEIAQALIVLLDPVRRQEYDRGLGKPSSPAVLERRPSAGRDAPVLPRGTSVPPTPERVPSSFSSARGELVTSSWCTGGGPCARPVPGRPERGDSPEERRREGRTAPPGEEHMAMRSLPTLFEYVPRRQRPSPSGAVPDAQLLERFLCQRDEAAFALLMWRHGPLVFGVCRRVLHHTEDAEDALQATFLTLVRKAGAISRRESVSG
jgi:hypothetical protein